MNAPRTLTIAEWAAESIAPKAQAPLEPYLIIKSTAAQATAYSEKHLAPQLNLQAAAQNEPIWQMIPVNNGSMALIEQHLKPPLTAQDLEWSIPSPIEQARKTVAAAHQVPVDHVYHTGLRYDANGLPLMEFEVFPVAEK